MIKPKFGRLGRCLKEETRVRGVMRSTGEIQLVLGECESLQASRHNKSMRAGESWTLRMYCKHDQVQIRSVQGDM